MIKKSLSATYPSFAGTGVAAVTPFDAQGEIDFDALRRIVAHLIAGGDGVDYIVALGTTAETPTLSASEQDAVLACIFEAVNQQVPVVVGCGGNDTRSVCAAAAAISQKWPAAGLLAVTPYYNRPSQEGLFQHYAALAGSTALPVVLYNVPGRTGVSLAPDTALRLAQQFPNICAIKDAAGKLEQGMELVEGRPAGFEVLSGDDLLVLPQLSLGYDGVISVAANAFPQEFSAMLRHARAGNFDAARSLHYRMLPLMRLMFSEGNPTGVKAMMALQGLCTSGLRLPLVPASKTLVAAQEKALAAFATSA